MAEPGTARKLTSTELDRDDARLRDADAEPHPDSLVKKAHFAGGTFSPMISTFTMDELKSSGDLRLLSNESLKWGMADYRDQIGPQVDKWMTWGDEGITETYFRELAFVLEPEPRRRDRAGTNRLLEAGYRLTGHRQP